MESKTHESEDENEEYFEWFIECDNELDPDIKTSVNVTSACVNAKYLRDPIYFLMAIYGICDKPGELALGPYQMIFKLKIRVVEWPQVIRETVIWYDQLKFKYENMSSDIPPQVSMKRFSVRELEHLRKSAIKALLPVAYSSLYRFAISGSWLSVLNTTARGKQKKIKFDEIVFFHGDPDQDIEVIRNRFTEIFDSSVSWGINASLPSFLYKTLMGYYPPKSTKVNFFAFELICLLYEMGVLAQNRPMIVTPSKKSEKESELELFLQIMPFKADFKMPIHHDIKGYDQISRENLSYLVLSALQITMTCGEEENRVFATSLLTLLERYDLKQNIKHEHETMRATIVEMLTSLFTSMVEIFENSRFIINVPLFCQLLQTAWEKQNLADLNSQQIGLAYLEECIHHIQTLCYLCNQTRDINHARAIVYMPRYDTSVLEYVIINFFTLEYTRSTNRAFPENSLKPLMPPTWLTPEVWFENWLTNEKPNEHAYNILNLHMMNSQSPEHLHLWFQPILAQQNLEKTPSYLTDEDGTELRKYKETAQVAATLIRDYCGGDTSDVLSNDLTSMNIEELKQVFPGMHKQCYFAKSMYDLLVNAYSQNKPFRHPITKKLFDLETVATILRLTNKPMPLVSEFVGGTLQTIENWYYYVGKENKFFKSKKRVPHSYLFSEVYVLFNDPPVEGSSQVLFYMLKFPFLSMNDDAEIFGALTDILKFNLVVGPKSIYLSNELQPFSKTRTWFVPHTNRLDPNAFTEFKRALQPFMFFDFI